MSVFNTAWVEKVITRIALNSVPVDGQYWYEATRWKQSAREQAQRTAEPEITARQHEQHWCTS